MGDFAALDARRETIGRLICYGTLAITVAISLTFAAGDITRSFASAWTVVPIYGNAAIAAIGVAVGALYGRGLPGRRIMTAFIAATAGAVCYGALFFIGAIGIITAWNRFGSN